MLQWNQRNECLFVFFKTERVLLHHCYFSVSAVDHWWSASALFSADPLQLTIIKIEKLATPPTKNISLAQVKYQCHSFFCLPPGEKNLIPFISCTMCCIVFPVSRIWAWNPTGIVQCSSHILSCTGELGRASVFCVCLRNDLQVPQRGVHLC